MGLFENALKHTLENEGVYSFDPDDPGGETYYGIARNRHPNWGGWNVIDRYKVEEKDIPRLEEDAALQISVAGFYLKNFWNAVGANSVSVDCPKVAVKLFDTAVNVGVGRSVKFLQSALNLVDDQNLVEDGKIGPMTRAALSDCCITRRREVYFMDAYRYYQCRHYATLSKKKPALKKYIRGWLRRAMS